MIFFIIKHYMVPKMNKITYTSNFQNNNFANSNMDPCAIFLVKYDGLILWLIYICWPTPPRPL
jgi:hypothetical protein